MGGRGVGTLGTRDGGVLVSRSLFLCCCCRQDDAGEILQRAQPSGHDRFGWAKSAGLRGRSTTEERQGSAPHHNFSQHKTAQAH